MRYLIGGLGVMFLTTALTRTLPFLLAARLGARPRLRNLGRKLPAAIMVLLSLQSLSEVDYLRYPHGLPEILASGVVLAVHGLGRNSLLSISVGTLAYALCSQFVFVPPIAP
ncbi:branched-chain amino acid transporter permease [Geothrix sp. 21YS21S-2]|uniref:branched-chain amino acid transporter permease n=1 Tax=Geothrix sp. 21YS21S-2 TaxID=3068893 RepID=UPI0027BA602A|nr:AzlD domain-containing protein [Geothrix sp. 21YS21S-2]